MKRCTYLLPIRRTAFSLAEAAEFAEYFQSLNEMGCDVLVIDGSPLFFSLPIFALWIGVSLGGMALLVYLSFLSLTAIGVAAIGLSRRQNLVERDRTRLDQRRTNRSAGRGTSA